MYRDFKVGDLVKMEPASEAFAALPAFDGLVIVMTELPTSSRFFDQFCLLSPAGEKISRKNFGVY